MSFSPLCWFDRHAPDVDRVHHRWLDYTSVCVHCDRPIRRRHDRTWSSYDAETRARQVG